VSQEEWIVREVFPGIMVDPQVVHGRPVVAGTRVPVEVVLGELAGGSTFDDVMREYHLTVEQIRTALAFAATQTAHWQPGSSRPDAAPAPHSQYAGDSQCERNMRMIPQRTIPRPPSRTITPH
ncbi:MAG TPA: DUF433 domain-containing protein, partial [Ktedonobacterales bacterium]